MWEKSYEEIAFQSAWERKAFLINGERWYCYCAFPSDYYQYEGRLSLTKGTSHQETDIKAHFDIFNGQEEDAFMAYRRGEDLSPFGTLSKVK